VVSELPPVLPKALAQTEYSVYPSFIRIWIRHWKETDRQYSYIDDLEISGPQINFAILLAGKNICCST